MLNICRSVIYLLYVCNSSTISSFITDLCSENNIFIVYVVHLYAARFHRVAIGVIIGHLDT